jgi:hypothetical protein
MFRAKVLVLTGILLLTLATACPAQAHQRKLEKLLPDCKCSCLHHLKGKKLWRHWIWHLSRDAAEYRRVCATVSGESGWHPDVPNHCGSGARGLFQFMPGWYNGVWWPYAFDPTDPVLSIRIFFYFIHGPHYGGWSNWAGH